MLNSLMIHAGVALEPREPGFSVERAELSGLLAKHVLNLWISAACDSVEDVARLRGSQSDSFTCECDWCSHVLYGSPLPEPPSRARQPTRYVLAQTFATVHSVEHDGLYEREPFFAPRCAEERLKGGCPADDTCFCRRVGTHDASQPELVERFRTRRIRYFLGCGFYLPA